VYQYTLEAVKKLFSMGCELIILACNTASAKALRTIQQNDLPIIAPEKRVLGVIRPSVEEVVSITRNDHVGILGTNGTVSSLSYVLELEKLLDGKLNIIQEACPMWVPIVENNVIDTEGADYFVRKNIENLLQNDQHIDTVILGCTHYPLLINTIKRYLPQHVKIVEQGPIVAHKLDDYLKRHPEMEERCSKGESVCYFTTENPDNFDEKASLFIDDAVKSKNINFL
ncbi:MAG: aspartate/glutamate racemase family protein, partial [Prolixibacteraceae bacterium]|nr:aspartate/glutamate racemase family protein [Prolixibacteraceae bacterium]